MDDNKIVELYLLRDETAIKQTAEKFGSRLRSLAHRIVNDRQLSLFAGIGIWILLLTFLNALLYPRAR